MVKHTDICIVGGGPAGYVAAIRAAQLGAKVALIEARELGGTCLNRGCIPTKALLKTAETMQALNKAKELGIEIASAPINIGTVMSRKDRIVRSLKSGVESLMARNGIELLQGRGTIVSPTSVAVETSEGDAEVVCGRLIIATGSKPLAPNIPGIELKGVITSDEALESDHIPQSITIIGAGAIGLEFATYYRSVGASVTVVEMMDAILPGEDEDVTAELLKIMKRQGVKFHLGAKVKEIRKNPGGLETLIESGENTVSLISDTVLAAIGRKLNCDTALMASLGIETREGSIVVNDRMETSVPGVYAAGDVVGGKLLAHLAFAEGKVAAENAAGMRSRLNYNAVPACVYTNPEVASVGLSERQAKEKGIEVKTGRFEFRNNGRALSHGEREGFVKVITESGNGVIIGARILGLHASELISELTLAVALGVKADVLADMIHPHPTLSECVMEACGDAAGRAIHK